MYTLTNQNFQHLFLTDTSITINMTKDYTAFQWAIAIRLYNIYHLSEEKDSSDQEFLNSSIELCSCSAWVNTNSDSYSDFCWQ